MPRNMHREHGDELRLEHGVYPKRWSRPSRQTGHAAARRPGSGGLNGGGDARDGRMEERGGAGGCRNHLINDGGTRDAVTASEILSAAIVVAGVWTPATLGFFSGVDVDLIDYRIAIDTLVGARRCRRDAERHPDLV